MDLFEVNHQTCNQDGICAAVCPAGIVDFEKGSYPVPSTEAEEICIRCGHCVAVCPTASLSHREMPVEACPPVQKALHLGSEQCEHFLRSRRSIRVYKDKPVGRDLLAKLIDIARYAPSGHNAQDAKWLVLENREELHTLSGIAVDWMRWMMENMSQIALSMHMDRAILRWESGVDSILRGAPALIIAYGEKENVRATTTCTIALTYLELAATSLDLGGCWAGYFNAAAIHFPPMAEALSLPEGHQSCGAMMVGYPKFRYHRLPLRNTPNITWR